MNTTSKLFSPLTLGPIRLDNRIVVSPMCQYSAREGNMQSWHRAHLGSLAVSGAGLLFIEATAVCAEGRITPACVGLYNDTNEASLKNVVNSLREISDIPIAMQLAHAGRKASSATPWNGGQLIPVSEGGWQTTAPSPIPHKPKEAAPVALDSAGMRNLVNSFRQATQRALRIGFDVIELHMAHGYLLHQFLSPIANQRTDEYGGSFANRTRFPLQILNAVREVIQSDAVAKSKTALGVRISASDWVQQGWDIQQSIEFSKLLETAGCEFIDVSSGGVAHDQTIELEPGYQVPFAAAIRKNTNMPVMAVGLITEPQHAEDILQLQHADAIALARGFLSDPRWPWRAAAQLGGSVKAPAQYWRSVPGGAPRAFGDTTFGQR